MTKAVQQKVIAILAAVMLTFTYFASGFAMCTGVPSVTEVISKSTSAFERSPYSYYDLVSLAGQTRDFTVDDHGRQDGGVEEAESRLASSVIAAAKDSSSEDSDTYDRWSEGALVLLEESDAMSDLELMEALYEVGPQYALNVEALDHLDDVNELLSRLFLPMLGASGIAVFCLMWAFWAFGKGPAGKALLYAGIATLALFALLLIWGCVSFDSLFTMLHAAFFEDGTWTFPANSLLIEMYPTAFWIGMGLVWAATSLTLAIVSIILGALLTRKPKPKAERS